MSALRPLFLAVTVASAIALSAVGVAPVFAGTASVVAGGEDPPSVLASGLDNPRGLAFGPDGALYVAEAGSGGAGPCQKTARGATLCFGRTGAITRIGGGRQRRVVEQLPSLAAAGGAKATGASDVTVDSHGALSYTIGLGGNPDARTAIPALAGMAKLYGPDGVTDLGRFEKRKNPDGAQPAETNPNAVLADGDLRYVVDAGGGSLLRVGPQGKVTTVAVFAPRPVRGTPMSAVPSSVVKGPDGAFYVAELTGSPYPAGLARIYRVVPGHTPQVYANGLTAVIDLAFGPDGALYALETARFGLTSPDQSGLLLRINPGAAPTVVETRLKAPSGLVIRGNDAYIANCGTCKGTGAVLRFRLS
jgi:hypothetical protein